MALERNWSIQSINNVPIDQTSDANQRASWWIAFKKFITGQFPVNATGAWTVVASSNGVVADTNDNWNGIADIVNAAPGNPHSWIVFKSPAGYMPGGGFIYLLFDLASADTRLAEQECSGFAYTLAGLTVNNRPTNPQPPARVAAGGTPAIWTNAALAPAHWHATRNTFGDFIFIVARDGEGFARSIIAAHALADFQANDLFSFAFNVQNINGSPGAPDRSFYEGGNGAVGTMPWINGQRDPSGGDNSFAAGTYFSPTGIDLLNGWAASDRITPNTTLGLPLYVINDAGVGYSFRGRFVDLHWCPTSLPVLSGVPSSAPDRCRIGTVLMPFSPAPTF